MVSSQSNIKKRGGSGRYLSEAVKYLNPESLPFFILVKDGVLRSKGHDIHSVVNLNEELIEQPETVQNNQDLLFSKYPKDLREEIFLEYRNLIREIDQPVHVYTTSTKEVDSNSISVDTLSYQILIGRHPFFNRRELH